MALSYAAGSKWEEAIALLTRAGEHVAASRALATPRAVRRSSSFLSTD
jgi:hypothetical protein